MKKFKDIESAMRKGGFPCVIADFPSKGSGVALTGSINFMVLLMVKLGLQDLKALNIDGFCYDRTADVLLADGSLNVKPGLILAPNGWIGPVGDRAGMTAKMAKLVS